jgi:hypothetical protein
MFPGLFILNYYLKKKNYFLVSRILTKVQSIGNRDWE